MVNIEGDYEAIQRYETGIYSLDWALSNNGQLGIPTNCTYEIYGHPHVGKSTLAYFLAGAFSEDKYIGLCDLEGFDKDYVSTCLDRSGFTGTLRLINEPFPKDYKGPKGHEGLLQWMTNNAIYDSAVRSVIMDSVGAIIPVMEMEGDYGEAFMGRRAKLVAQVARKLCLMKQKGTPVIAFIVNHVHSILSGQGSTTAGGDTLKFLSSVRINVFPKEVVKSSEDELPIMYLMEGRVEKLKFGGKGKRFYCTNIPGYGISKDMSAVYDCINLGLAERGAVVKVQDKSVGRISKLIESAIEQDKEKFAPFYEVIDEYKRITNKRVEATPD